MATDVVAEDEALDWIESAVDDGLAFCSEDDDFGADGGSRTPTGFLFGLCYR